MLIQMEMSTLARGVLHKTRRVEQYWRELQERIQHDDEKEAEDRTADAAGDLYNPSLGQSGRDPGVAAGLMSSSQHPFAHSCRTTILKHLHPDQDSTTTASFSLPQDDNQTSPARNQSLSSALEVATLTFLTELRELVVLIPSKLPRLTLSGWWLTSDDEDMDGYLHPKWIGSAYVGLQEALRAAFQWFDRLEVMIQDQLAHASVTGDVQGTRSVVANGWLLDNLREASVLLRQAPRVCRLDVTLRNCMLVDYDDNNEGDTRTTSVLEALFLDERFWSAPLDMTATKDEVHITPETMPFSVPRNETTRSSSRATRRVFEVERLVMDHCIDIRGNVPSEVSVTYRGLLATLAALGPRKHLRELHLRECIWSYNLLWTLALFCLGMPRGCFTEMSVDARPGFFWRQPTGPNVPSLPPLPTAVVRGGGGGAGEPLRLGALRSLLIRPSHDSTTGQPTGWETSSILPRAPITSHAQPLQLGLVEILRHSTSLSSLVLAGVPLPAWGGVQILETLESFVRSSRLSHSIACPEPPRNAEGPPLQLVLECCPQVTPMFQRMLEQRLEELVAARSTAMTSFNRSVKMLSSTDML